MLTVQVGNIMQVLRAIRTHAKMTCQMFEASFELGLAYPNEASSHITDETVLLSDENLPLDVRLYCRWYSDQERRLGDWYWYPPEQILRYPYEDSHLVAVRGRGEQILYYQNAKRWVVHKKTEEPECYTSLTDVLKSLLSSDFQV